MLLLEPSFLKERETDNKISNFKMPDKSVCLPNTFLDPWTRFTTKPMASRQVQQPETVHQAEELRQGPVSVRVTIHNDVEE